MSFRIVLAIWQGVWKKRQRVSGFQLPVRQTIPASVPCHRVHPSRTRRVPQACVEPWLDVKQDAKDVCPNLTTPSPTLPFAVPPLNTHVCHACAVMGMHTSTTCAGRSPRRGEKIDCANKSTAAHFTRLHQRVRCREAMSQPRRAMSS